MKFRIKEWFLNIATLGPIGRLPFGEHIATLLAFPLLVILGWMYLLSATLLYVVASIIVLLAVISVYIALNFETEEHPGVIVIGHLLGMLAVFTCINMTLKIAIIGFILFYGMRYVLPLVMRKLVGEQFEKWPLIVTIFGVNIFSGIAVNTFLQFVVWLAN